MDYEAQLKLQAFLDGELSEAETREVANWLARNKEAVELLAELRNTRQAMVGTEIGIELPEPREFYWSKIQHQIERLQEVTPREVPVPFHVRLRQYLAPAAAVALLVIGGLLVNYEVRPRGGGIETVLDDSSAFTYHDYSAGATLVWLSYAADNDVADDDEMITID